MVGSAIPVKVVPRIGLKYGKLSAQVRLSGVPVHRESKGKEGKRGIEPRKIIQTRGSCGKLKGHGGVGGAYSARMAKRNTESNDYLFVQ